MSKTTHIEENLPHKASEVFCSWCFYKWIAVRPCSCKTKDLECAGCHQQGYVIETGELFDFGEESF